MEQRHGEQTRKLIPVVCAKDAKITDVLNGSGKEKFTDCNC